MGQDPLNFTERIFFNSIPFKFILLDVSLVKDANICDALATYFGSNLLHLKTVVLILGNLVASYWLLILSLYYLV